MRTISTEELKTILENHKHWLYEDCEGWKDMRANLGYANLGYADLRNANLTDANLRNANLTDANLTDANLRNANLTDADLRNANLGYANLRYADLRNANLRNANLTDADLRNAKNVPYIPMICPEEGEFIGWKKASASNGEGVIVKLEIPASAKRSSATSRKCRCNKAKVLEIYNLYGTIAEERVC